MKRELDSVKEEHDVVKVLASDVLTFAASSVNVCLLELPASSARVQFEFETVGLRASPYAGMCTVHLFYRVSRN